MGYIGNRPADSYTSFAVQHFTTSATTTYTLDNPVANENEIALFINNVRQEPGSSYAYTASGTTLTLSAATSASDTMYCVFIGKAVQTVTPANGSVTGAMMSYPLTNFSSTGIDDNATSTAITIDTSQNVLVGKTSQDSGATVGTEILSGRIFLRRSGGAPLIADRDGGGGEIVVFREAGTKIGSINDRSNQLSIGSSDTGLEFNNANDRIQPFNMDTNNTTDNAIDLGGSGVRFRHLYMGGNIYLGGTGSANALDDYEEGTFNFTLEASGSNPTVAYYERGGSYTKIGNRVFIHGVVYPSSISGGSGAIRFTGLPFTADQKGVGAVVFDRVRITNASAAYPTTVAVVAEQSTTYVTLNEMNDNSDETRSNVNVDDLASNPYIAFSLQYRTAS